MDDNLLERDSDYSDRVSSLWRLQVEQSVIERMTDKTMRGISKRFNYLAAQVR